ncbi:hypothetical protein TcasGA2_TC033448 [Tribolium castaneum]|uniref:Uncharacterized protein n=1 Tax=Tribolium castaneum TaxID=7070 RepID=A0A139WGC6_TRICA|nr:hypothetical protein TcasGA2_TC033448 [Tribolium castaneum]
MIELYNKIDFLLACHWSDNNYSLFCKRQTHFFTSF